MDRDTIEIQLTPTERSLLLRYGYPFAQIERALKACSASKAIEIVRTSTFWYHSTSPRPRLSPVEFLPALADFLPKIRAGYRRRNLPASLAFASNCVLAFVLPDSLLVRAIDDSCILVLRHQFLFGHRLLLFSE